MVQVVAEHEAARLVGETLHSLHAHIVALALMRGVLTIFRRVLITIILGVLLVRNGIFTCLLIELALHEDVEEHGDGRIVCKLATYISRPEERV